jgi:protein-L-isoaspartate(D-aspartate) O-methyltransferase
MKYSTHRWPSFLLCLLAVLIAIAAYQRASFAATDRWPELRAVMVQTIKGYAATLPETAGTGGISDNVLKVMSEVPRHRFVPKRVEHRAYQDRPLPIGHGQTISQPFVVALMTELLQVNRNAKVLEIGTGSGYQAAVLARLAETVCTIEIIPELADAATGRLKDLGYGNVQTKTGDGYFGWPDCGPFDGIIVTAAAGHVPPPLIKQLKPGGRMVIPVGGVFGPQYLTLVEKTATGELKTRQLLPVRFVPFTRGSP